MSSKLVENSELIFRQRLAEVRKKMGLTQGQLAEKISIIRQAIGNFENGHNLPAYSVLVDLADALDVSLDYLTGRSDDPEVRK